MPNPKITCRHCEGSGEVELPRHLMETLKILKRHKTMTAEAFFASLPPGYTRSAANRRLEELRSLGFARRERQGRNFIYSPTEATA